MKKKEKQLIQALISFAQILHSENYSEGFSWYLASFQTQMVNLVLR